MSFEGLSRCLLGRSSILRSGPGFLRCHNHRGRRRAAEIVPSAAGL